ncbi:hypothetical protein V6Z12_A04G045500 [Gossypium hirsutum]
MSMHYFLIKFSIICYCRRHFCFHFADFQDMGLSKKPMSMPVRGKGKRDHRFDNVDHALILFNKMIEKYPMPSIVEFNKLLGAIVKMKHYLIVVSKYRRIELLGVSHDVYSMSILINCFCQLGRIDFGLSVLGKMLKLGFEPSAISEAVSMFDGMIESGYQPNLITGNTGRAVRFLRLMESRGYEPDINGLLQEALNLLSEMKVKGIRPNQEEATRLLNETVDNNISLDIEGKVSKAVETVDLMRKQGIEPDVVRYNTLVDALCKEGMRGIEPNNEMDKARRVFNLMIEKGCAPDIVTYNILVDAHCKQGMVFEAKDIVDSMRKRGIEPNVVTYSVLVNARRVFSLMIEKGCAPNIRLGEAMELFHEISQKGPIPDTVTYNTLVQSMFQKMLASGQVPNIVTCNIVLDGLCKTGIRNSGLELDIVPYTILINGLCKAGHIEVAKELFHQLSDNGLKPNVYTYCVMINGLCKEGLPDEAYRLFGSMGDNDCLPNSCCYNAKQLLTEMVDKGFFADIGTATLFMDLIVYSNKSILL